MANTGRGTLSRKTRNYIISTGMAADFVDALYSGRVSGGRLSPNVGNVTVDIAAGVYRMQGLAVTGAGTTAVAITGADTTGTQYKKVVITIKRSGAYGMYVGTAAASQAAAQKPTIPLLTIASAAVGSSTVATAAVRGATSVVLASGASFASTGLCVISGDVYEFTKSSNTLTLLTPLLAAAAVGAAVVEAGYEQVETGWVEIPPNFTVGATSVTAAMCKQSAPKEAKLGSLLPRF